MNGQALVTGGAGFIGSHLIQKLIRDGLRVTVLDNFSTGRIENIKFASSKSSINMLKTDLKNPRNLSQIIEQNDIVFHLAANPEVRVGQIDPQIHFEENVLATNHLLKALHQARQRKIIVFTSTSTVYGEARIKPTPEDYGPLIPISTYGASKLACEALISSCAHTFNHRALILRLANIVGSRSNHGVIYDFIEKIQQNPDELEILGDGKQQKSYMYISDCIDAIMHLTAIFEEDNELVDIYNVGSRDKILVKEIAEIVTKEMKKPNTDYKFTGGVDGGRGWKGDVKTMQLSIKKLENTGWKPKYNSSEAVRLAARDLLKEKKIMER